MVRAGTGTTQSALGPEESGRRARLVVADLGFFKRSITAAPGVYHHGQSDR